jgi:hypothetical protein
MIAKESVPGRYMRKGIAAISHCMTALGRLSSIIEARKYAKLKGSQPSRK